MDVGLTFLFLLHLAGFVGLLRFLRWMDEEGARLGAARRAEEEEKMTARIARLSPPSLPIPCDACGELHPPRFHDVHGLLHHGWLCLACSVKARRAA